MLNYIKLIFPYYQSIIKISLILLLSGLIGIEREIHDKPVGARSIMLVALGTVLFVIAGLSVLGLTNADMARLLYAPIMGIGFLGSGILIQKQGQVSGITTATTLWAIVGIGLIIGMGIYELGIISTLIIYSILKSKKIEEKIK